jgi:hypothetical protein
MPLAVRRTSLVVKGSPFQPKVQQKPHLQLKLENISPVRYLQEFSSTCRLSAYTKAQPFDNNLKAPENSA